MNVSILFRRRTRRRDNFSGCRRRAIVVVEDKEIPVVEDEDIVVVEDEHSSSSSETNISSSSKANKPSRFFLVIRPDHQIGVKIFQFFFAQTFFVEIFWSGTFSVREFSVRPKVFRPSVRPKKLSWELGSSKWNRKLKVQTSNVFICVPPEAGVQL